MELGTSRKTVGSDTTYGLAAALFTENLKKAHRVAARVQAGTVWVIPLIPTLDVLAKYCLELG
jgi:acyl-CoA reductase-like NAD-dependent aldehyde dehydrogenase